MHGEHQTIVYSIYSPVYVSTKYLRVSVPYRYMWLCKVFGEELWIAVDKIFGCRSARLLGERVQLLQRERVDQ